MRADTVRLEHLLGVAVIGRDEAHATACERRLDDPAECGVRCLDRLTTAGITPVCPTMSGFAKLTTQKAYPSGSAATTSSATPAADISGFSSYPATSRGDGTSTRVSPSHSDSSPPLKKYVTCAYFSVSAAWSCRSAGRAQRFRERVDDFLLGEGDRRVDVLRVPGHRRQVDAPLEQASGELPPPIRSEVEEDRGIGARTQARSACAAPLAR